MAIGERCPACGHLPGFDDPHFAAQRAQLMIQLAVDLTRHTSLPADSPEQIAVRLATLHGALMGLSFAKQPDPPPA